ncbi:MAG: alpha/beta hydrolase [Myxococcota bacterium]|nr:alpha/beta hydrolase [Myxococcota bacterium]
MSERSIRARAARSALRTALLAPAPFLRGLTGPVPKSDRGHDLDLSTHALLRVVLSGREPAASRGVGFMRNDMDVNGPLADFERCALHRVEDRYIPGAGHTLRVRVYEPGPRGPAPRPICVYYHGGGFVLGSLRSHDGVCGRIAKQADCIVVSVDYRLAPEHRFPAATNDAIAAYRWAVASASELGGDPQRIAVAGDSAGGNLAAVVAWHERAADPPPRFQLLVYPVTDWTHATESYERFAKGFLLETETSKWFRSQYLVDFARDAADPMASVLVAPCVRGAPPAYVVTAGFDPLRDEGERYARKLEEAGVRVQLHCEESLTHGFFSLGGIVEASRRAIDRAIAALASGVRA